MPACRVVSRRTLPLVVCLLLALGVAAVAVVRGRTIARHEVELWARVPGGRIRS